MNSIFKNASTKSRYFLILLIILLISAVAFVLFFNIKSVESAIESNTVSTNGCDCNQLTISNHNISGERPFVVVGMGLEDGGTNKTVSSVTYNGQQLTRLSQAVNTNKARTDVWFLDPGDNPAEGNHDVVINLNNNNRISAAAITFTGVDHSNPIDLDTVQTDAGNGFTSSSVSVPSDSGDVVMNVASIEKSSITFGLGQLERWNLPIGGGDFFTGASTKESSGEEVTMKTTFGDSKNFSHIGFNINRAPECDDGVDNDGDGQIDYPNDDGCSSPGDDIETDPAGSGGGSTNIKVQYSGFAYPDGRVTFKLEDENGNTCKNIDDSVFRTNDNGRFQRSFDLCFKENPIIGVQATDQEGTVTNINSVDRYYSQNTYFVEDIIFPPTLKFEDANVIKGEVIQIYGFTVPNSEVEVIVDGTFISNVRSSREGFWDHEISTKDFKVGNHSVRVRLVEPYESDFSRSINFSVNNLSGEKADLNEDDILDISDISIFLFRWNDNGIIKETIDFNDDGVVDISDLSIFLESFSR